ncbi:MAG: hypothetical protein RL081_1944 [Pseudomonadota bacterium]
MKFPRTMNRRTVLRAGTALAAGAATGGVLQGCSPEVTEPQAPLPFTSGKPLPWTNWAGNQAWQRQRHGTCRWRKPFF